MSPTERESGVAQRDLVQSLVKGLAVLQAFGPERTSMTMTQVAGVTGLTKPSARRFLLTLQSLGYLERNGEKFHLLPKVLDLGLAYFASLGLPEIVEPYLDELNEQVKEACSVGILDGDTVIYVARSQWQRVRSAVVRVGTRIDPATTALGRVLLAALDPQELETFLAAHRFERYTEHTIADAGRLRAALDQVRRDGWALCDQEVELGMRTLAVPLHDGTGAVVAGVNVAANYVRVPLERLMSEVLPLLRSTAAAISADLAVYGRAVALS